MERKPTDTEEAVTLGCSALMALERTGHPSFFLPLARALIFYESFRVGVGFGVEYGKGFVISRIPFSAASPTHAPWSAPCFIKVNTVQMGAVIGLKRSVNVVGILGEAALRRVMGGRGYHATAEWGASIDIGIFYDAHQRAYLAPEAGGACIHAWGAMVDVGLTGMSIRIDKKKNELNYGHGITADDILLGNVAPPSEFSKLFDSIGQVSNAANMAAFIDSSTASTTQITMSRSQKPQ